MARRNSKEVRVSGRSQRKIRSLEKLKRHKDPRKDGRTWADRLLDKIKEMDTNER